MTRLWDWWIRDAMGCKPKTYGANRGKVGKHDIVFACFMTSFLGLFALFLAFMLLCGIIATKGVLLVILAVAGGVVYGLYKAIETTAGKERS